MTNSEWFTVVINPHFEVRGSYATAEQSPPLLGSFLARLVEAPFGPELAQFKGALRAIELRQGADNPPVYLLDSHELAHAIDWYYFPHRSALFTPTASSVRQASKKPARRTESNRF